MNSTRQREGATYALLAYGLWGFMAIYFKQITFASSSELLAHSVLWSFVFTSILILLWKRLPQVKAVLLNPNHLMVLLISSLLVGLNWLFGQCKTITC